MVPIIEQKPGLPNTPEGIDRIRLTVLKGKVERLTRDIDEIGRFIDVTVAAAALQRALYASPESFRSSD